MRKSTYEALKAMHKCVVCRKNQADDGYTTCLICRMDMREKGDTHSAEEKAKHNEWLRERRQRLREQGICYYCGKRPAASGRKFCSVCLAKCRVRTENRRRAADIDSRILFDGVDRCTRCGSPKQDNGHKVCDSCYEVLRAAMLYARSCRKGINDFERYNKAFWASKHEEKRRKENGKTKLL